MIQLEKKPANHLTTAYNQILQDMRDVFHQTQMRNISLQKSLELAKHRSVYNSRITAEEAQEIGEIIKRDINDAAEYLMDTSDEFCDWVMLDIEIIERKVIDLFLSVADNTRIKLSQF